MINDYFEKNPNESFENSELDELNESQDEISNSNYYKLKLEETCIVLVDTKQGVMTFLDEIILSKKSDLTLKRDDLKEYVFVGVDTGTIFYKVIQ